MASMFGGNTGWTYDQIQQKRKIAAELMAANANTPRNVGEGLNAIGRALAVRGIEKRADKRDAELKGEYDQKLGGLLGGTSFAPATGGASYTPPAPVDPASPQGIATDTMAALGKGPDFAALEQQYGLPQGYLQRTAQIESGGNPNAQNPNSSAGGMFQFIDSTAKQYGLENKFDPMASADAAARLARDNLGYLKQALGREPSAGELYLAHQQGAGGAAKLLAAGNAPAASVVGGDAARLNGGNGMSAADFAGKWTGKFGGQPQQPQADLGTIAELLSNPYASAGDKAILGAMLQRQMDASDPLRQMQLQKGQLELEQMRTPQAPEELTTRRALAAEAGLQPGTPEYRSYMATGDLPKGETPTDLMREYDMAVSQGYKGTIQQYQIDLEEAGASSTTINNGGAPDLGKLSTDYGYVLDPATGQPKINPETGLPMAAPVPGSPAAVEAERLAGKKDRTQTQGKLKLGTSLENINRNIAEIKDGGLPVTGAWGDARRWWLGRALTGNNATDFANRTAQITDSAALAEIQNMRDNSPTGGAVGALTEGERTAIGNAVTSLNNATSAEEYTRAATNYRTLMLDLSYGEGTWELDADGNVQLKAAPTAPPSRGAGGYTIKRID